MWNGRTAVMPIRRIAVHHHVVPIPMLVRRMSTRHSIGKRALVHHAGVRHSAGGDRTAVAWHQVWVSQSITSPHAIRPERCVRVIVPVFTQPAMARFPRACFALHARVWVAGTSRVVRRIAVTALPTEGTAHTYPPATHNNAICIESLENRIIVCVGVRPIRPDQSGGRRVRLSWRQKLHVDGTADGSEHGVHVLIRDVMRQTSHHEGLAFTLEIAVAAARKSWGKTHSIHFDGE